jgi:hypothetical protein
MILDLGKYYLYRHIRLDTNQPFYIGIGTKTFYKNSDYYHRATNKRDRSIHWKNIIAKTPYEVEILLESDDYEFIKQKEREFIKLYGRRDLGLGTLVNYTDGGEGSQNKIFTDELREKYRKPMLGNKHRLNHKWSEETRQKIKDIHKNRDNKNKKKVLKYSLDNELIAEYESIIEAQKAINCKSDAIGNCLRGLSKSSYGFIWKYKN